MSEFHDDYPQYEVMSNHGEEEGKKNRRTLWNVFWIMLGITIIELVIGSMAPGHGWSGTLWLKVLFIGLTLAKAAAIVLWFMHLGHEVKFFKYVILTPYIVFMFYTIFIILTEGTYSGSAGHFTKIDPIFMEQQEALKKEHHEPEEGAHHDASGAVQENNGAEHH
jgi:cytochrome c oxidase subunit 4